ncbi:unnamed protein product [Amaranthus hypochondriacus]
MSERELGFLKPSVPSLKEQLARKTLRNVRSQGHTYVDLREDGKRYIFFCTLCLAPCYSDVVLLDHLRGSLHKERLSAAKATLIGDNPWPFNDGVLFFDNTCDEEEKVVHFKGNGKLNSMDDHRYADNLAMVVHNGSSKKGVNGFVNGTEESIDHCFGDDEDNANDEESIELVIPGVIGKDDVSDLRVRLIGYGQVSARLLERDGVQTGIQRIWCEWLGKNGCAKNEVDFSLPSHDFAIVTFSYFYDLGKQGLFDEIKTLLLTGENVTNGDGSTKRRKKSFSDSEDASGVSSYQCDSSGDDSRGSTSANSALLLHRYDDHLLHSRVISSKTLRREWRRQQRVASEKMCDICQHKMLPGKDVATLLNLKTGKLACSSRNVHGAFHVFHTSCLMHWVLLCEFEMFMKPPLHTKVRRRSRRRTKSKVNQLGKDCKSDVNVIKRKQRWKENEELTLCDRICSVFCPDCQGTGLHLEGDELEKPTVSLSEMFKYKIKAISAHRAWMKCPEELENCSTGFAFPVMADDAEGKVTKMKLLHFYRAEDESLCKPS